MLSERWLQGIYSSRVIRSLVGNCRKSLHQRSLLLSIFLSPLSHEEILFLQSQERSLSLADFLTDIMRRKLLRRTQRQKKYPVVKRSRKHRTSGRERLYRTQRSV